MDRNSQLFYDPDTVPRTPGELRGVCDTLAHIVSVCVGILRTIEPEHYGEAEALRDLIERADLLADNVHLWPADLPSAAAPAPLSDDEIDAICAPGRAQRWQNDGRRYDRETARLIEHAVLARVARQ